MSTDVHPEKDEVQDKMLWECERKNFVSSIWSSDNLVPITDGKMWKVQTDPIEGGYDSFVVLLFSVTFGRKKLRGVLKV